MKKNYEAPEFDVTVFSNVSDILLASGDEEDNDIYPDMGDLWG